MLDGMDVEPIASGVSQNGKPAVLGSLPESGPVMAAMSHKRSSTGLLLAETRCDDRRAKPPEIPERS
jgi:hypothetical protein